jgi:phosphate transport system substrate-binding protein
MNTLKLQLLAAAAVIGAFAGTAAQAQVAIAAVSINGAGASLPQNIARQAGDCYGLKSPLGFGVSSGSAPGGVSLFDFTFDTPTADTLGNHFECSGNSANGLIVSPFTGSRIVQPNVSQRYLSTGSGQGLTAYLNNRVSSSIIHSAGFTPYTSAEGYQYSLSETALSSGNLTTYNTALINPFTRYAAADTAANLFGPAIQVPFVVAPIAIAYDPVYAKERNNGGLINEYRFTVTGARADGSGGLKLTRAQYCGILNGTITNWNQLPATVVKADINDPAPFNVPIRLVGRSETSGTTSVFTRAIAAQCNGLSVNTGVGGTGPSTPIVNKFGNSEARLPYDGVTTVAGTAYTGAAGTVSTTNSLSGAFYDKASNTITIGTEAVGLFTVANGNDGVAAATNYHPDPSATVGDRTLNGRVAYASPEQTLPATLFNGANGYQLHTSSLQVNGVGTTFVGPDGKQASAAFAGTQPPQSKGTAGAYCTDAALCPAAYGDRANPLAWVQASDKSVPNAAPVKGYPLIGTSNILLYTCYATPERRQAVNGFVATVMGKTTKDFNNQAIPAAMFSDATKGLFAKNGLAPLPGAWKNAITETFLKKSVQVGVVGNATTQLGLRNLWIQDKIPTTNTVLGSTTNGNVTICAGKPGA